MVAMTEFAWRAPTREKSCAAPVLNYGSVTMPSVARQSGGATAIGF
jgi:hypothetical protein